MKAKTFLLSVVLLFVGVSIFAVNNKKKKEVTSSMSLQITSSAFGEGEFIPLRYTCDGPDVSPPLNWTGTPTGCKSFALICDDPDAPVGTWVHWVIYNIPPSSHGLKENVPKEVELKDGTKQGINDFRRIGYGGPCPPHGVPHRYFFKLYALSKMLTLPSGATKDQLLSAMEGSILAKAELMGRYRRK